MEENFLFPGVAVVIDDEIDKEANIKDIVSQITGKDMPYLAYKEVPDDAVVKHWRGISFLLLDWRLLAEDVSDQVTAGVTTPAVLSAESIKENVDFLKKFGEQCFAPVFIFTNEDIQNVITVLKENGLYQEGKANYIFVKNKQDLVGNKLFDEVNSWIKTTPTVYVLKEWDRNYEKAKNRLFHDFYGLSPDWPRILWATFKEDGADMAEEMVNVINMNVQTRMVPFPFDESCLNGALGVGDTAEVSRVLEGERFIKHAQLNQDNISTGDFFKVECQEGGVTKTQYFLNIRPQCDLMRGADLDKVDLYCLKCRIVDVSKINGEGGVCLQQGQFIEKINHALIPFIDDGKVIEVLFKDLKIKPWRELKDKRLGRILPPYIMRIQQRYALYLHRHGLPRIPDGVIGTRKV